MDYKQRVLTGTKLLIHSIEEMAAHYINEIRSVQQEGPYFLAGYCLGGILSFEMAQQLTRQGQIVALLASINGVSPTYTVSSDLIEIEEGDNPEENTNLPSKTIGHYWKKFMFLSAKEKMVLPLKVLIKKSLTYNQQFRIRKFLYNYYISRNKPLPEALGKYYFLETNGAIARAYKPLPYPGRMIIFRSPLIYPDPYLGWNGFVTGGIETCDIPGKHRNRREIMNEPFVQHTAKELNNYLEAWDNLTFRNKVIKELRV
ncbi:MAG: thioesterase domain-containing protein [Chitinophagaceae bacterium]